MIFPIHRSKFKFKKTHRRDKRCETARHSIIYYYNIAKLYILYYLYYKYTNSKTGGGVRMLLCIILRIIIMHTAI